MPCRGLIYMVERGRERETSSPLAASLLAGIQPGRHGTLTA
jgi:hypothetical protein